MNITELTVHELSNMLENGSITNLAITNAYAEEIHAKEEKINSFVTLLEEDARKEASRVDILRKEGKEKGRYAGIPIGIKDNICTKGIKTTCSSKMLEHFVSPYDATVLELLKEEKIPILGKMNLDEFAMGSSTEHSYFGPSKNPWDLSKVPGGSSGGSVAAVAANMLPWALGSETGGSVRQPASLCGVVGLKPTYGLVSRYGLVAFASSLDQIGPVTKDVEDCAILLGLISGYDPKDSTSSKQMKKDYTQNLKKDIKGLKIGIPKEYLQEGISKSVKEKILEMAEEYRKLGAIVQECNLESGKYALATYYIIACAEASSNLGRFDGIRYGYRAEQFDSLKELYQNARSEGFGAEVKRRIILGTYVLSSGYYDAYYRKALKVRTLITKDFERLFETYDVLLTPTTPGTAFAFGEKAANPLQMYLEDLCTVPVNIAGVPAISIPVGVDESGLPIGMQLIGKHFEEETILQVAYQLEQKMKFRAQYKPTMRGGN